MCDLFSVQTQVFCEGFIGLFKNRTGNTTDFREKVVEKVEAGNPQLRWEGNSMLIQFSHLTLMEGKHKEINL